MPTVTAMDDVGVRELRQNLSVYLRRIAQGETLRVTDHGHPVALLTPIRYTGESVLDELEARAGWTSGRRAGRRRCPSRCRRPRASPPLSEILQQKREGDWR